MTAVPHSQAKDVYGYTALLSYSFVSPNLHSAGILLIVLGFSNRGAASDDHRHRCDIFKTLLFVLVELFCG
jgi:hypothetical protein